MFTSTERKNFTTGISLPAVIGDQAVDDRNVGVEMHEAPRQVRSDKAEASRYQNACPRKFVFHHRPGFQLLQAAITDSVSSSVRNGWIGNDSSHCANRRALIGSAAAWHEPARKAGCSGMIRR